MSMKDDGQQTFEDTVCPVCGCVCDDLRLLVAQGQVVQAEGACGLAEPWFRELHRTPAEARVQSQEVSSSEALRVARNILVNSRSPLIFGLSRSSTDGQRAAVRLADQLGATIDTTASVCHGPSIMAIQQVGESTCSLGEVRNRADLVVFWGADPVQTHPRHLERYSRVPSGQFIERGRAGRTMIVVDARSTPTSEAADLFIQVQADCDFELIWALRQLVQGQQPNIRSTIGPTQQRLQELADRLMSCRYGVVFFGLGLARSSGGHANVEALLRLVAELNRHTRFAARRMRQPGDVTGADLVLCWQAGYPFAVNFARGYPRYNPTEYSANELLRRAEVDACLLVGSESVDWLSAEAQATLQGIPTIALDYPHLQPNRQFTVQFTTAVYGIHASGTAYRMDEVPLPLHKLWDSPYPTDAEILTQLGKATGKRR